MSKKAKSSIHSTLHPYMRQELWANGTLVFWNTASHRKEAYQDFYERMCKKAAKLSKI